MRGMQPHGPTCPFVPEGLYDSLELEERDGKRGERVGGYVKLGTLYKMDWRDLQKRHGGTNMVDGPSMERVIMLAVGVLRDDWEEGLWGVVRQWTMKMMKAVEEGTADESIWYDKEDLQEFLDDLKRWKKMDNKESNSVKRDKEKTAWKKLGHVRQRKYWQDESRVKRKLYREQGTSMAEYRALYEAKKIDDMPYELESVHTGTMEWVKTCKNSYPHYKPEQSKTQWRRKIKKQAKLAERWKEVREIKRRMRKVVRRKK